MGARWDETWHRLSEWTSGQGPSERLAAQVLLEDGFTQLDPSHPLGGRDGKKDAIAWRSNEKWVMAVYFPRGRQPFGEIKEKLISDFAGVAPNGAAALAFVTNQELSLSERSELRNSVPGRIEIYHLERITAILDKPSMRSVRAQFLGISQEVDVSLPKLVFVRTISGTTQIPDNLIGRAQDIAAVAQFLGPSPSASEPPASILVIAGMPGVGKTALALREARNAVSQGLFTGGAITIDFNGYALNASDRVKPQQVLSSVLLALGYAEIEYDASVMFTRLQSILAELDASGKRVLLLFDNVAQASQIEPLIPLSREHRIIVTSRNALAPRLLSSEELRLTPLSVSEGIDLIVQTSLYSRGEISKYKDGMEEGLERLATICDGLPIALQLVGEILRNEQALTPIELAEELRSNSMCLGGLEFEDAEIRAVFEGSYARLPKATAKCFRYISIHPAQEFSVDAVAALLRTDKLEVRRAFRTLEGSHLIMRELDRPTWRMHDLLLLYSAELFGLKDGPGEEKSALSSLNDYYFAMTEQANEWLNATSTAGGRAVFQSRSEALTWLSTEISGIVASVEATSKNSDYNNAWRLGITAGMYLDIIGDKASCLAMAQTALMAAQALEDAEKEAGALNNVGLALNNLQRFSEAKSIFIQASKKYREIGNRSGQATVILGLCDALRAEGSIRETVGPLRRAVRLYMEDGDTRGSGFALTNLGITLREGGEFEDAIDALSLALKVHEETGAKRAESSTLVQLGTALLQAGNHAVGISYLIRGRDCAKEIGDIGCFGAACTNIGNEYRRRRDFKTAKAHYLRAVEECEKSDEAASLARALWNLIGLSQDMKDFRSASHYLGRLQAIPRNELPPDVRRRLYGDVLGAID